MLFVRDKGQMCNNMLQYAHVYAWGREHGRNTMSMRFAYKYQYFRICHSRWHWFWMYLAGKWGAALHLLPVITFPFEKNQDISAQIEAMNSNKHAVVQGWRAEFFDLFLKYKEDIIALFQFDDSIRKQVMPQMIPYKNCTKLGVHIRRGDYKTFYGGKYFFDDKVFIDYIKAFATGKNDVHVFICGNDPNINKELFKQELPEVTVHFPNGNPGEDLCLLSECNYLIGPPSTFSLVASMYRDIPICWMETKEPLLQFDIFDNLFKQIK